MCPNHWYISDDDMLHPICKLRLTSQNSIPDNTFTTISWGFVVVDSGGMADLGDLTKITCTVAGYYLAVFNTYWQNGVNGTKRLGLITSYDKDDVAVGTWAKSTAYAMDNTAQSLVAVLYMDVGDYISGRVKHTDGAALNFVTTQSFLSLIHIR